MSTYDDFEEPSELDIEALTEDERSRAAFDRLMARRAPWERDFSHRHPSALDHTHDHGVVKAGWYCSREFDHEGPCAAWPISHEANAPVADFEADMRARVRVFRWLVGTTAFVIAFGVLMAVCGQ